MTATETTTEATAAAKASPPPRQTSSTTAVRSGAVTATSHTNGRTARQARASDHSTLARRSVEGRMARAAAPQRTYPSSHPTAVTPGTYSLEAATTA